MTTEERFNEKFPTLSFYGKGTDEQMDTADKLSGCFTRDDKNLPAEILAFIESEKLLARAGERERIVNLAIKAKNRYEGLLASDALPGLLAFLKGKIMSLDDLLSSLDNPTDKKV